MDFAVSIMSAHFLHRGVVFGVVYVKDGLPVLSAILVARKSSSEGKGSWW